MKEFTVGKNDANQRLDRWLSKNLPLLPAPLAQKYIRLKRVKLNGKGAKRDTRLPVSYTHLDVYKRQMYPSSSWTRPAFSTTSTVTMTA